jgi:UDP-N-acetylmuramoylalanine-D-glutamate ligase
MSAVTAVEKLFSGSGSLREKKKQYPVTVCSFLPACASWGMFENYEQRGELFKELVRNLSK